MTLTSFWRPAGGLLAAEMTGRATGTGLPLPQGLTGYGAKPPG